MKIKTTLCLFAQVMLIFMVGEHTIGQCTNCQGSTSSASQASSAIGDRAKASGFASFASGSNVIASGDFSSSLGSRSQADGDYSFTLGSNIMSIAEGSMVLGQGFGINSGDRLINLKPKSLMIGFNSTYPTLFVSASGSRTSTGKVGIGNVTDPQAKLHVRADHGEKASIFIEQPDFREAEIILGNEDYGIRSTDGQGLIFRSRTNYLFNDGSVAIGTIYPDHDLEVHGSTFTNKFTLYDKDIYTENIEGWVLRSAGDGQAFWTDPALLADQDWMFKENSIYRLEGNVGIGTSNPVAQLDLADIYTAGGLNLKVGNDAYLSDVDMAHTLGILSQQNPEQASIMLGLTGPLLSGKEKKLGIGTSDPMSTLEVNNNIASGGNVGICIANGNAFRWFVGMNHSQKYVSDLLIGNNENINNGPSTFLVIKPDGSVGIGTNDTHSYKLAVNGAILTEEITVNVSENWPDYVFSKEYDMLSLHQLEDYIKYHGHLPEIPDAKEIRDNGLKVGEMERLLLKKVEELTLYIIEQETRISAMENIIDRMRY